MEYLMLFAVLIPLAGGITITAIGKEKELLRNIVAVITSMTTAVVVISFSWLVFNSQEPLTFSLLKIAPNLELAMQADPLSAIFATLASTLWVLAVFYSIGYLSHAKKKKRYFICYLTSLGVTMGIAFSANLFTLYLFYEFLTMATYPLVVHEGSTDARAAGVKYMIYSFIGAGMILLAIIGVYSLAGVLTFQQGGILSADMPISSLVIIFFLFLFGFGVKAAIMPFHSWLPAAMAAPTPVSALLHAVAVVKAGIYGILRVMYTVFGVDSLQAMNISNYTIVIISITILLASVTALYQDSLKKRLAYSTISQLGYITLGAALLSPMALKGGLFHLVNHALMKITLFFCAGLIISVTGKKNISQLAGVAKQMPLTMLAFTIASVAMIGVLPLNGFISKWYLVEGSMETGNYIIVAVLVASSLLNAFYFLPIITTAFFKKGDFVRKPGFEAPISMLIPTALLALSCIIVGLFIGAAMPIMDKTVTYLFW